MREPGWNHSLVESRPISIPCRLILDPPRSGAWNMAVDEVLLESAVDGELPCLRFYFWTPATVSLGYFQPVGAVSECPSARNCPVVRRASGGGAIIHDNELTYSLSVGPADVEAFGRLRLYRIMHETLVEALSRFGVRAELCGEAKAPSPFLCFQRHYDTDVLVGKVKIAGSAQRRREGAVLQHGSVLLRRSEAAPELDSIEEAAGLVISTGALIEAWLNVLARRLGFAWKERPLSGDERRRAEVIMAEKYGNEDWNAAR